MRLGSWSLLWALTAIVYDEVMPQDVAPKPGPCEDCGEPATCYGRSGLKCDACCHDWCCPMPIVEK